jgi:hypothetical protein
MTAFIWSAIALLELPAASHTNLAAGLIGAVLVAVLLTNLPLVPVGIVFSILVAEATMPPRLFALLGTLVAWSSWFAIVLFHERRARLNAAIALNIDGPPRTCLDVARKLGVIGIADDLPPDLSTNPRYFDGFGKS